MKSASKTARLWVFFLRCQPWATVSWCSSECQQVIFFTSVTKEKAWECRWKRKEPDTRASGQMEKALLRVDKHVNI